MKLCTVVHRVSLLLVVCDQSPTLWGTTFGQFELLSAHRADELAPNRDPSQASSYTFLPIAATHTATQCLIYQISGASKISM